MIDRPEYVALISDLLSGDAAQVRSANAELYRLLVGDESNPDVVLAQVATSRAEQIV